MLTQGQMHIGQVECAVRTDQLEQITQHTFSAIGTLPGDLEVITPATYLDTQTLFDQLDVLI